MATDMPGGSAESELDGRARRDEEQYVHQVYETIASHFSSTRYKPWPGISKFFDGLPAGSLGLDAGCGNGKYLGLRSALLPRAARTDPSAASASASSSRKGKGRAAAQDAAQDADSVEIEDSNLQPKQQAGPIITIGLDRSSNLLQIAKERSHEVLVGDAIDMPWREGMFDFAISIATIHHFTTPSRRKESVRTMLRALNKRHGKLFIQVWAVEQAPPAGGEPGRGPNSAGHKPLLKKQRDMDKLEEANQKLESLDLTSKDRQDVFVPWKLQQRNKRADPPEEHSQTNAATPDAPVYQRYYHLFRAGELHALVQQAAQEELVGQDREHFHLCPTELWEQGNWCILAEFDAQT